jgi:hypothetical protein
MGDVYTREMENRRYRTEANYDRILAEREEATKVKNKPVRTMIASGYWAGMET